MDETLAILDELLTLTKDRSMFTAAEITDFVLDVRQAITKMTSEATPALV